MDRCESAQSYSPKTLSCLDLEVVNKLYRKLALITSKVVPNDSGDKELDQWGSHLELCATERSTNIEKSSTAYQLPAKAMVDEMGNKLRDMLRADWLEILLLRSQRFVWHGGQDVRCNPPQPKASVDALVQSLDKQSSLCYTLTRWMYPLQ